MFGITELSFDFLTGQPLLTALFLVLFLLLSILLYRRTNPPLSGAMRILLTALRAIAVIALFLALSEPVLSYKREYQRKPRLAILVDRSKSMDIVDETLTRSGRVDSLLEGDRFRDFESHFDVSLSHFAGSIAEDGGELDRDRTALGEVLGELAGSEMAQPSEAWLLLSDGISNSGISPVEVAPGLSTPVYAVGVGLETSERDIAISGLDYNKVVFAGKPTELAVRLEWRGMSNDKAEIEVRSGEKVLTTATASLPSGDLTEDFKLKFTPEKPGRKAFRVVVSGPGDELSQENNSRSFAMTVLKSKMNVLLASDRLDWESSFLKRFLAESESVDLTTLVFKEGGYLTGVFPSEQAELNRYDLIILYDVNPERLRSRKMMFESFLKDKGGSLMIMLGKNYLASDFPRWLDDYLPFLAVGKRAEVVYLKYSGIPAENFLFHPAVRISESRQGIRESWRSLPPFEALVLADSVVRNSEILVTADLGAGTANPPIVGYRNVGRGKVLATGALPFWHWAFFGYGFGEDDDEYRKFFGGIVNWLSITEDTDPIRIAPDKTVYTRGEPVGFDAYVYDLGYRPIGSASGYVALVNPESGDTTISQLVEKGDGRYRADFDHLASGRYNYTGIIDKEGKRLKESSGQLAVETFSIEEYFRRPDFGSLENLSQTTGGRFYKLAEADSLFSAIDMRDITISEQSEIILWNRFWLLTLFILVLALEWLLRKRYQLI
jgi:hypothetical protein